MSCYFFWFKEQDNFSQKPTPDLLSCDEMILFWVRWDGGLVEVGTGSVAGQERFLYLDDQSKHLDINAVSVAAGEQAEWYFIGALGNEFFSKWKKDSLHVGLC